MTASPCCWRLVLARRVDDLGLFGRQRRFAHGEILSWGFSGRRRAAGRASRRTSASRAGRSSWNGPVSAGSWKLTGSWAARATSPRRPAIGGGNVGSEPALVDGLLAADDPRHVAGSARCRRRAARRRRRWPRATTGSAPHPTAGRPSPGGRGSGSMMRVADVDLAVVGGHQRAPPRAAAGRGRRRRAGRRRAARRRRSRRTRARGRSCRCRRSRRRRSARRRRSSRPTSTGMADGGPPADRAGSPQVGLGERGALQLGRRHHRHLVAEEGGEGLDVAGREGSPAVTGR